SSRRRHTRSKRDWSSDVCSSDLPAAADWATWLGHLPHLPLPPLRLILIWDNLAGHLSSSIVTWLFAHGVMPLYTPLSGSWLNLRSEERRVGKEGRSRWST